MNYKTIMAFIAIAITLSLVGRSVNQPSNNIGAGNGCAGWFKHQVGRPDTDQNPYLVAAIKKIDAQLPVITHGEYQYHEPRVRTWKKQQWFAAQYQ